MDSSILYHTDVHANTLTDTTWYQESLVGAVIAAGTRQEAATQGTGANVAFNFQRRDDQQAPTAQTASLTGTVTVANGSTAVTGSSTTFTTQAAVGSWLTFGSASTTGYDTLSYQVKTVTCGHGDRAQSRRTPALDLGCVLPAHDLHRAGSAPLRDCPRRSPAGNRQRRQREQSAHHAQRPADEAHAILSASQSGLADDVGLWHDLRGHSSRLRRDSQLLNNPPKKGRMIMGTILASQSLAGGATVTSGAFPFSVYDDITATVLNANPPPNQSPMVTLLLSADNVNYVAADRRIIGQTPSQAFYHIFALQNFAGFIPGAPGWDFLTGADVFTGTATGLTAAAVNTVQSFKLKFENLGTVAVTVAANDGCSQNIAVIPLTGVQPPRVVLSPAGHRQAAGA